jgi:hypothetical protein
MKESFSIFSAISNLFEERQGLEKSGRGVAKRRWKRRSSCKKSKKTPQEWKGTEEQRLFPLFETQRRILPHEIEESSTRDRTALLVKEESQKRTRKSAHEEEEDTRKNLHKQIEEPLPSGVSLYLIFQEKDLRERRFNRTLEKNLSRSSSDLQPLRGETRVQTEHPPPRGREERSFIKKMQQNPQDS